MEAPPIVKGSRTAVGGGAPFESTGPFRIVRRLGQGGFAPVYLAEEVHEGRKLREVALKLFFFDSGEGGRSPETAAARERVIDEARALCRVEHPNVVRFHAVHRDDALGVLALVMEHVWGESLFVRLHDRGTLDDAEVIDVGVEIAWALAAVHDAGLVHGDVKPSNVIRGPRGHKLIDFGIATDLAPASADAPVVGTPGYLAPERLEGAPPSASTDLYALGVTLHRLRTGKMPVLASDAPALDGPGADARANDGRGSDRGGDAPGAEGAGKDARASERGGDARSRDARASDRGGDARASDRGGDGRAGGAHAGAGADSDPLGRLIGRLIALEPHERPQRAAQVARELSALRPRREPSRELPAVRARGEHGGAEDPTLTDHGARGLAQAQPQATLAHHPPLVGRDGALRALAAWAARTSEGRLSVTLIRGPLGAGRTRLLDAAIEAAGAPPTRVLRGACSPERQSSFLPLLRALEAVPRGRGPGLSAIEEAASDALDPKTLGASRDPRAAVEAVEEALLWAAASDPLVLAIDDAQWGDPYTITLLVLLCDRAHAGGEGKLHIVIAARDEPRPSGPLRALFAAARSRPDGSVTTIALGPLSPEDLTAAAAGVGALAPDLSQAVVRAAGGIPFFLVHALFAWRDTGAIVFRDGAWRAVDPARLLAGVPGVAELVEARLASAFEGDAAASRVAMRTLAAVALYGGVTLDTLLATCGDPDAVEAALETLVGMEILAVRGPRFEHAFAQEMIRQAVLNLVRDKPWLARLHRALLDKLAAAPEAQVDAAFLAAGYDELGDADLARTWLRRAMERAIAAGLLAEAVAMGDRRAALARTPTERAEAQLDTVRALLAARRFEDADVRLRLIEPSLAASSAGEREQSRRSEPGLAASSAGEREQGRRGEPGAASGAAERERLDLRRRVFALQVARGLHSARDDASLLPAVDATADLALRCDARMALAGAASGPRALALASDAVALAEGGDPAIEYRARVARAELIYASDARDLAMAHRDLTRAAAIAEATGSKLQRLQMESDLAAVEAEQGDVDAAIDRFARLADEADAQGMRGERRRLVQNRAALLLRRGRSQEAADAAAEAARLSREAGDPVLCASAWSIRADALRRTGALREARDAIDQALRLQEERGDRMRALSLLRRAEIARLLGDLDPASRDAAQAAALARGGADHWIAVAADLWEVFHRAQTGAASREDLERALAEAAAPDVSPRAMVRSLVLRATAWLRGDPPPDTRN